MIAATTEEGLVAQSADLIALFRSGEVASAVWHVDISPSTPLMRLCGAWITDDTDVLRNILAARIILPFGGSVSSAPCHRLRETVSGSMTHDPWRSTPVTARCESSTTKSAVAPGTSPLQGTPNARAGLIDA